MSVRVLIEDGNASIVGKIKEISLTAEKNNISTYEVTTTYEDNVLSETSNMGKNVFIIGESKVGDGSTFASSYDGYIGTTKSDSEGNVSDFYIILSGEGIARIKINFDGIKNQYATRMAINGAIVANNNFSFNYELPTPIDNVTIQILNWNIPNAFIKITSITTALTLEYTERKGLQEIIRGSQMIDDNTLPKFGIISNYGSIRVIDKDLKIENLANQNLLETEKDVRIYFNNKLIGTYLTNNFNKDGNMVDIELKDKLLALQNIYIDKYYISNEEYEDYDVTILSILLRTLELNGYALTPLTISIISERLEELNFDVRYIFESSLWELLNKICQIIGMRMWLNENGLLEGVIL